MTRGRRLGVPALIIVMFLLVLGASFADETSDKGDLDRLSRAASEGRLALKGATVTEAFKILWAVMVLDSKVEAKTEMRLTITMPKATLKDMLIRLGDGYGLRYEVVDSSHVIVKDKAP